MESRKLELKKHVAFIHCSNHLTLLQRKISNALLHNAYDELPTKEQHSIGMGELVKLIGYASNDYALIKSSIKVLISTVLEWNLLNDDFSSTDIEPNREGESKSWHASAILASAKIQGSKCTYSYSPELRSLLFMPEIYGKINLSIQARFNSVYALVLYENCVRYKNLNSTRWFSMDLFRKLMGISEGRYSVYRDMKRKVVDKAISEVNAFSDLTVSAEIQRSNQKVTAIRFIIQQKDSSACLPDPLLLKQSKIKSIDDPLISKLTRIFGIAPLHAKKIVGEFGYDFVTKKAAMLEQTLKTSGKNIKNLAGYFIKSLHNEQQLDETKIQNAEAEERRAREREVASRFAEQYENYLNQKIIEKYAVINQVEKDLILNGFEKSLGHGGFLEAYRRKGLGDALVQLEFVRYIRQCQKSFCEDFLSFANFCKAQQSQKSKCN